MSYILKGEEEARHCFGVNAVAIPQSTPQVLYTAGRDSTIIAWNTSSTHAEPKHLKSFQHHTDWVNDIFLIDDASVRTYSTRNIEYCKIDYNPLIFTCAVVSASSDTNIKIWNTETAECLQTLTKRTAQPLRFFSRSIHSQFRRC